MTLDAAHKLLDRVCERYGGCLLSADETEERMGLAGRVIIGEGKHRRDVTVLIHKEPQGWRVSGPAGTWHSKDIPDDLATAYGYVLGYPPPERLGP